MTFTKFSKEDVEKGATLFRAGKVSNILFSEGTYQIEVEEGENYWPFLQLSDFGKVIDCFCTCFTAEKRGTCEHLAAALFSLFDEDKVPLHVRFRDSLWNQLTRIFGYRYGYEPTILVGNLKDGYEIRKGEKELFFSLKALDKEGMAKATEILEERTLETEDTSLKFSNLPSEELKKWREGRPSHKLRYELSFWSDLAKWLFVLQEQGKEYELSFTDGEGSLPINVHICFTEVKLYFHLVHEDWISLVSSIEKIKCSLKVFDLFEKDLRTISYDEEKKIFHIDSVPLPPSPYGAVPVDHKWIYAPRVGFYPTARNPYLEKECIEKEEIGKALEESTPLFLKHLKETPLHLRGRPAQYDLFFDEENNFHIQLYVEEKRDLNKGNNDLFGSWAYLSDWGFFPITNLLFEEKETIVPKEKMSDFITTHRNWLNLFEGFQTHLSSLQTRISYELKDNCLRFFSQGIGGEISQEMIDLGQWYFVRGKGFYAKKGGKTGSQVHDGLIVVEEEIAPFISQNREDLESITGFFAAHSPLKQFGLKVEINGEGNIEVSPEYLFYSHYSPEKVHIFGHFLFVEGEGFSEISEKYRFPARYTQKRVIQKKEEPLFLIQEIDALHPFITKLDPRLIKPKEMYIRILQVKRDEKAIKGKWLFELVYESEAGTVPLYDVYEALRNKRPYLFSEAGLIVLRQARFQWLKQISKKRWQQKGRFIRLTTLEWIKLCVLEEIKEPLGSGKKAQKSRELLEMHNTMRAIRAINLTGFSSTLRSYQEVGLHWLWFLYSQDLSGLLCDEMGLGKTHQAMALCAAAYNEARTLNKPFKAIVVCPTSVLFHWEELLKRFFPSIDVHLHYGVVRNLNPFIEKGGLLLTSYGIVRSDKTLLQKITFDLAIYDEVQKAKNARSQTHRSLAAIQAKMILGLTGTPIENDLTELKALFDLVLPGYFPSDAQFRKEFLYAIEKEGDAAKKEVLHRLIKPFLLRRKKEEVLLELPEKIEEIAYCTLSEEQQQLYSAAIDESKQWIEQDLKDNQKPIPYIHVFALISKLKQICNHPCMIHKKFSDYKKHASGKWELLTELIEEARQSNLKVVIFSQYLGMLDLIERYLCEENIQFAGIRGATRDRKAEVARFRDDPECAIFVASLQAAGVGIDLISASIVIHYDRWWNPAVENQATDRVHRLGQSRGVQVFKMVTKGTIEENIYQLIERKKSLFEEVIQFDDQEQIKKLSRQELIELLQLTI